MIVIGFITSGIATFERCKLNTKIHITIASDTFCAELLHFIELLFHLFPAFFTIYQRFIIGVAFVAVIIPTRWICHMRRDPYTI